MASGMAIRTPMRADTYQGAVAERQMDASFSLVFPESSGIESAGRVIWKFLLVTGFDCFGLVTLVPVKLKTRSG